LGCSLAALDFPCNDQRQLYAYGIGVIV